MSLAAVPLFPLPNVVLLPRAVLPLHIFEERYKQMTADVPIPLHHSPAGADLIESVIAGEVPEKLDCVA